MDVGSSGRESGEDAVRPGTGLADMAGMLASSGVASGEGNTSLPSSPSVSPSSSSSAFSSSTSASAASASFAAPSSSSFPFPSPRTAPDAEVATSEGAAAMLAGRSGSGMMSDGGSGRSGGVRGGEIMAVGAFHGPVEGGEENSERGGRRSSMEAWEFVGGASNGRTTSRLSGEREYWSTGGPGAAVYFSHPSSSMGRLKSWMSPMSS